MKALSRSCRRRSSLTLALLPAVVGGLAAGTVEAQDEEIVVYGQKLARQRALDQKRESSTIIDAMSTDDLGRLPDKNAAESINRLPGVSILVEKGEGRYAAIRGIKPDWNAVTINGFATGSPEKEDSARQVALDVLGGEMLESVQVIKMRTPDMDGQGIGGVVNLVPKRPLDADEPFAATMQVRFGVQELDQPSPYYAERDPYSADVNMLGRLSDRVAWTLGGSFTSRRYLGQGIYQDDWAEVTLDLDLPERTKNNYYVIGRERETLNGGLDLAVGESSRLMLQLFHTKFEEFQHRNRFEQILPQDAAAIDSIDGNRITLLPGTTGVTANLRREDIDKSISTFMVKGETPLQTWQLDYGASVGRTELTEPNSDWIFGERMGDFGPDTLLVSGDGVVTVLEGGAIAHNDPANFDFDEVRYQDDRVKERLWSVNFDAERPYSLAGLAASAKLGFKLSSTEKRMDFRQDRYSGAFNLAAVPGLSAGPFINDVDGAARPNVWMDLAALDGYFAANPNLFPPSGSNANRDLASDREVSEDVTALYLMNTVDIGKLSVIGGVRWEQTDVSSVARQARAGGFETVASDGDSDALLPSLIATYGITDDLLLRAGWTSSLGRPDLAHLSATSSFSIDVEGIGQLSIGNPNLDARESDNFDVSLEWYFSDYSLLSLAWFRKDVKNEIITRTQVVPGGVYEGVDYGVDTLHVNTRVNADDAEIDGLELNLQHQFEGLPAPFNGFGFSLSFTRIDASFFDSGLNARRPLEDQPEKSQSYTLFYQNGALDVALTYNYNESFLTDLEDFTDPSDDLYQGEFGRIDLRASYRLTDRVSLFVEGVNLNNEPTSEFAGGDKLRNTEFEWVGSTWYIGAAARF